MQVVVSFKNFNCTIQELKLFKDIIKEEEFREFQLHHTGIKT